MFYAVLATFVGLCAATWPLQLEVLSSEPLGRALAVGVVLVGVVLSVTLHEYGHAVTAYWGGDRSVVAKGYLTLDFRKYAHPLLSVGMPVLFLAMGALPLPGGAVLIEEHRLRSRVWSSLVSLSGVADERGLRPRPRRRPGLGRAGHPQPRAPVVARLPPRRSR